MTTREQIRAEIENVGPEDLDELHRLIRDFAAAKAARGRPGLMERLQGVRIEAPADFAANLDLYKSGEKRVEDGLR